LLEDRAAPTAAPPVPNSFGVSGIDAADIITRFGLTGAGVNIGQVEPGRVGKAEARNAAGDVIRPADAYHHPGVAPAGVFAQNQPGTLNNRGEIEGPPGEEKFHATSVASVIIGNNANYRGLAPSSALYSSALLPGGVVPPGNTAADLRKAHESVILSTQHVATRAALAAVNHSHGLPPANPKKLDGSEFVALGLDYLAVKHDTLHVVARDNDTVRAFVSLATAYNSLVVAHTDPDANGRYTFTKQSAPTSVDRTRPLVHLVAPGKDIKTLGYVPDPNAAGKFLPSDTPVDKEGTSVAAPHVTAAVSLLTHYAVLTGLPQLAANHLVQKAVLINSADKLEGKLVGPDLAAPAGQPRSVGMSKTVLDLAASDWLASKAADIKKAYPPNASPQVKKQIDDENQQRRIRPLDDSYGAGALNVRRAVTQLSGGPQGVVHAGAPKFIAWDAGAIAKSPPERCGARLYETRLSTACPKDWSVPVGHTGLGAAGVDEGR
jgi:hypothetical protein